MAISCLLLAAVTFQALETYQDPKLGLAFSYPKTWTTTRKRDVTTLTIPLEGAVGVARLEVTNVAFRGQADQWQTLQRQTNDQLKRETARQWQQEILGVPMLMTKTRYLDKGEDTTVTSALFYTLSNQKLLFRLRSLTGDVEKSDYALQQTLESLRTLSDAPAQAEDPSKPVVVPVPPKPKPTEIAVKKTELSNPGTVRRRPSDYRQLEVPVSGRTLYLRYPKSFSATMGEGRVVLLASPELSAPVEVSLFAVADSEAPRVRNQRLALASLGTYKTVDLREDDLDHLTPFGVKANGVWRVGKDGEGDLLSVDEVLELTEHYASIRYRTRVTKKFADDRRNLRKLIDGLEIAVQP